MSSAKLYPDECPAFEVLVRGGYDSISYGSTFEGCLVEVRGELVLHGAINQAIALPVGDELPFWFPRHVRPLTPAAVAMIDRAEGWR